MPEERLQKILSQAGVASRRQAEKIMLEGRVTVNGKVISELGSKADLETDHIKVDGKLLRFVCVDPSKLATVIVDLDAGGVMHWDAVALEGRCVARAVVP